jgi:exodeoxyribonuclease V gamma subunit
VLHIHRSERADGLLGALGDLLAQPPADPFAPEVVSVPTRGMERWLTQKLAGHLGTSESRNDGICANIEFPSPHRLIAGAIARASGVDPDDDPWLPERSAWPLLDVINNHVHEPWLQTLRNHLKADQARPHRLTTVRHIAELFDRYALHRPAMIRAWASGSDADGDGGALHDADRWQAELWRHLRASIGSAGPAERIETARKRIAEDAGVLAELPTRLSIFGLTRLAAGHLLVLEAIAANRDVHLFLLHPSPGLWTEVAQATLGRLTVTTRREDHTAELPGNRLLASWGRDAREMQLVLQRLEQHTTSHDAPKKTNAKTATTLLQHIQRDIHRNRQPPGAPNVDSKDRRARLHPQDRSIQIHSCHGRARQVEVIRDAILHALQDDPGLELRDVIVMCPDVETFAPLIHASFGTTAGTELPDLRIRLADRSLRQTNPLLGAVSHLLELVDGRITASQVLDFAEREPVRRRFELADADIAQLQAWIAETGIRWGLDADHRGPFKLQNLETGTWRAGLDRVLLGVTMTEDGQRLFERVLPADDVDSGTIDAAGRFAELIARIAATAEDFDDTKTIDRWAQAIASASDALTKTSDRESWQRAELQRILDELGSSSEAELALPEVRALLAESLAGRPTRTNFRTGSLTICTLAPMRSVPHRVVCLLGIDDEVFPRKAARDGDDLMLQDPRVGERDGRSEDRQMLLDALLAAQERLIITYSGNDERTNAIRPPAVPVGELLDAIDATATAPDGGDARSHVTTRHPLQPFDPRNFARGALTSATTNSWSFDRVTLAGAEAMSGPRTQEPPFLGQMLKAIDNDVVEVEDLVRFVQHPVRAFLRRRLGISVVDYSDEVEDGLRVELDALQRWAVGQRMLDSRLAGVPARDAALAEIARGELPPGLLGRPTIAAVNPIVEALVQAVHAVRGAGARPGSLDVRVTLADGRSLRGTVPDVTEALLCTATYSRLGARHRIASWVRLLALTAARPELPFTAVTIGRGSGDGVNVATVAPLGQTPDARRQTAIAQIHDLLDIYDRGLREPLPIYAKTSAAYAEAAIAGLDPAGPAGPAAKEWTSEYRFDKEDREPEHLLVLGGELEFATLLQTPPAPGEHWDSLDPSRLGRLAHRLWSGLLAREQLTAQ